MHRRTRSAAFCLFPSGLAGLALGLLCALILALPAKAVPPKYLEVDDARLLTASGILSVAFSVSVDNVTGLYEMLKDGASVELVAAAKLERLRTLWANATLVETEVFSSLQHNPLTREFALYMPGEATPMLDKNLERLLAATWQKYVVPLGPLTLLDGGEDASYRVTLTLSLRHAKPPPWLAKDFMLWSRNIVEPEVVELPFNR